MNTWLPAITGLAITGWILLGIVLLDNRLLLDEIEKRREANASWKHAHQPEMFDTVWADVQTLLTREDRP